MKPYPKYKPSDIQWLGDIPEHWEVKKLKYVSFIKLGKMLTPEDKGNFFLKPYLRAQNINWLKTNVEDVKEMWFSETELETFRIKHNDLLVSEGGEVGRTCIWEDELEECYIQNSVHKVSFSDAHVSKFFLYQFYYFGKTGHFDSIVNRISIAHLTGEKLKEVNFIVPPLPEQTAIAQFLDPKTAQIDTLIAQKQRLITLLKEERMAFINEVLSDESYPLKKLKYVVDLVNQKMSNQESNFKIALENIESGTGRIINLDVDKEFEGELRGFEKDDILFSKLRPYLCKVYLAEKEGTCVGELLIFRPKPFVLPKFLFYKVFSQEFINAVDGSTYGTKMPRASWEDFISHQLIPCPPLETQQKIVKSIETTTGKIDATLAKIVQEIELLKEYRVALISEVVTGKVSVV